MTVLIIPIDKIQRLFEYRKNDLYWVETPTYTTHPVDMSLPAGRVSKGVRRIGLDNQTYLAHRLVWSFHTGEQPPAIVSHVDKNSLNNDIFNLFENNFQNIQKRRTKVNKRESGRTGVQKHASGTGWLASITQKNGGQITKYFVDLDEAIAQRVAWEKEHGYKNT